MAQLAPVDMTRESKSADGVALRSGDHCAAGLQIERRRLELRRLAMPPRAAAEGNGQAQSRIVVDKK